MTIGEDIYISLFPNPFHRVNDSTSMFRLTQCEKGYLVWDVIEEENSKQTPSPREYHSAWEHGGHFWIFGGQGPPPRDAHHLTDYGDFSGSCNNQLLQFNIDLRGWKNIQCFGAIPKPRMQHASTIIENTVWLYGGRQLPVWQNAPIFNDLYELDLDTLCWTMIQTGETKPPGCYECTLNALSGSQLVLHGGRQTHNSFLNGLTVWNGTWILDLPSRTWRHYEASMHNLRVHHTGTSGLNNDVIIIGGISPDSRAASGHYYATKDGCHVMLEPKHLQHLAMRAVFQHGVELPWKEHIPKKLIKLMDLNLFYVPPKTDKRGKIDTSSPSLVSPVSKTVQGIGMASAAVSGVSGSALRYILVAIVLLLCIIWII